METNQGKLRMGGFSSRLGVAAAVLGLTVHFGFTALHVSPMNPFSQQMWQPTQAWINPFFAQNWQLFAPDPVSTDTGLLVKGTTASGAGDEFLDITTPTLERKLHNPLPDHLHYTVTGAGHNLLTARQRIVENPEVLEQFPEVADSQVFLSAEILEAAPDGLRESYELTIRSLVSLASDSIAESTGNTPEAVQVRFVTHTFPRWSNRHEEGVGEIVYSDSPWMDLSGREVEGE